MNLKYFLFLFLILNQANISLSQQTTSNLQNINKLIEESFIPLNNKLLILGSDKLYQVIMDGEQEDDLYLFEKFKQDFRNYKLIIGESTDSADYILRFKSPQIETGYKKIFTDRVLGTKKVKREVTVSYDLDVINKDNSLNIYGNNFNKTIRDNFDLDKLSFVEDANYPFSQSDLPEEDTFSQVLFPAIIIAATSAAIILFFVIRSK